MHPCPTWRAKEVVLQAPVHAPRAEKVAVTHSRWGSWRQVAAEPRSALKPDLASSTTGQTSPWTRWLSKYLAGCVQEVVGTKKLRLGLICCRFQYAGLWMEFEYNNQGGFDTMDWKAANLRGPCFT
jgi:hypothetical protein